MFMSTSLNQEVLVSDANHFAVVGLNSYAHDVGPIDQARVIAEHAGIITSLQDAGIEVTQVESPPESHAGIFTANWALCIGNTAVMSRLPGPRSREEPRAEESLRALGKEIVIPPFRFSGQGDALRCGDLLFTASGYRTDPRMPEWLAEKFPDLDVISLNTVPELDKDGNPVINKVSGWPDSFFYDIDLALSVLRSGPEALIGWCPEAFTPESQEKVRALPIEKIEVSTEEAIGGMACNLVSTGKVVIMSDRAPKYRAAIEAHGLPTVTPEIDELAKSGGCIRCTTLTLR